MLKGPRMENSKISAYDPGALKWNDGKQNQSETEETHITTDSMANSHDADYKVAMHYNQPAKRELLLHKK
ncbi:hypothetical protein E5288_WYG020567 [Bos mutus]|uniref:Uncharacterized protein n=1 Tax=Bos mutus TaxID=72004 RepID=A0A6B0RIM3_9CETA|nr:hypothetical protein [Bos mutus]